MTDTVTISNAMLSNVLSILQVSASRGAFKVEEYKIVGSIYDNLKSLLPQPQEETATDVPPSTTETSNATDGVKTV